jgi:hypothetical protein
MHLIKQTGGEEAQQPNAERVECNNRQEPHCRSRYSCQTHLLSHLQDVTEKGRCKSFAKVEGRFFIAFLNLQPVQLQQTGQHVLMLK